MKKVFLTILAITLFKTINAQKIDVGVKAGLNYNFGGDLSELATATGNAIQDGITGANGKAGYHVGLYLKARLLGFYLRPELVYTQLNNSYSSKSSNSISTDFSTKKLDIPILIGTKVIGPLHIYAGPAFQYILDSDLNSSQFTNIQTDDFSVGLQIGTGLEFGKLGIDARWEKGLTNTLSADTSFPGTNIELDNRPNQIIFSLSYKFN